MSRSAASGTKRLFKKHHGCPKGRPPTACDCEWKARYRGREIVLAKWARCRIDPHTKTLAVQVLTRFLAAVDNGTFDPAGERPALGTAETLATFITEWQTHYADVQGLSQNSLASMLGVLSAGALGGYSLERLAGNSQEIERWLNDTGQARAWTNKTWNEYRGLLLRVLSQATRWKVNGKARLSVNPVAEIAVRVAVEPDHFTVRHLVEEIEDQLFAKVDALNRPQQRPNRHKLTQETADAIRARVAAGEPGVVVALAYGVSPAVVSAIKHGDIWNPARVTVGTKGAEMRRRLIAAFDGGLRAGEMLRIQLEHVSRRPVLLPRADGPPLEAYEIRLPPAITKGGKTTGKVEIVYAATDRFRQVLEARRFQLGHNRPAKQYIFGREDGSFQKGFRRMWHELFTLAGIGYGRDAGLVWHTIRHEFVSRLAELTKDPVLTQGLARHRDLKTTQRYFHSRRDRQIAAVASLNRRS